MFRSDPFPSTAPNSQPRSSPRDKKTKEQAIRALEQKLHDLRSEFFTRWDEIDDELAELKRRPSSSRNSTSCPTSSLRMVLLDGDRTLERLVYIQSTVIGSKQCISNISFNDPDPPHASALRESSRAARSLNTSGGSNECDSAH